MRKLLPIVLVASALITTEAQSQASPATSNPIFDDSTGESPIYPVGDAIQVYRAVLDLIYIDGNRRPGVIVMLDSAEGHAGGPCPIAKCIATWKHKSKMDTATVLAYARLSRKRPGIRPFGYPIPIVFISMDDVQRMDADGRELIALQPAANDLPKRTWGFWAELQRKYPGAWGAVILTKVGFNKQHTEALVHAHEWCSDDCRVHETFFLRQSKGQWQIIERIPEEVEPGYSPFGRYLGPAGATRSESEIVIHDRAGIPPEAIARADVYRAVLDSLYSVNNERPKRIVLTNWFNSLGGVPAHTSTIDADLVKRFSFLGAIRAPLDAISRYRVPVSRLHVDSVRAMRERGESLDVEQTGHPFWVAFTKKYPSAWGTLGLSRIAFNANRSQALVSTYHACGNDCATGDVWFLTRSGKQWQIVERIPRDQRAGLDMEPLRYLGADVSPIAYRPRRVQGVLTDAETGKPVPAVTIRVRRTLNSGLNVEESHLRTDSLGQFILTKLPLNGAMNLLFECPNGSRDGMVSMPLYVTPGLDTTINASVSLAACNYVPPDSGRASGVSSIPHGPSFAQRVRWIYFAAGANPDLRTRMSTCLNLIPLNEKYPPGEVVVRAISESGASPL
jgi:hypothetical protein